MYVHLYIDKYYLLDLYDRELVPKMVWLIISDVKNRLVMKDTDITTKLINKYQIVPCLNEDNIKVTCEKYLKIKL